MKKFGCATVFSRNVIDSYQILSRASDEYDPNRNIMNLMPKSVWDGPRQNTLSCGCVHRSDEFAAGSL